VPANAGGPRKRPPRAQIAIGERFHARGVPARRGRHGVPVTAPPKPGKKTVSAAPPVPANTGGPRSGCPARKSRLGSVSTRAAFRPDVGGMGSQWRHRRNREKKRYRRPPRCQQMPGAPGSGRPARKSRLGSVSTRAAFRPDVGGMGSQWWHHRNREKKRYRRAPRCQQMPGAPGSGCPARKSRLGSVSTRAAFRPDVGGMGSQWWHRRNREKKRYRRVPRCQQMPGAPGSGCPARNSFIKLLQKNPACVS
jgi:hypothetical protein